MSAARHATRNPAAGTHPDLFEGESRIYVPLEELTEEEIVKLPRAAFSDGEWGDLEERVQEKIYENDPVSVELVTRLTDALDEMTPTLDNDSAFSYVEELFEHDVADLAGRDALAARVPQEVLDSFREDFPAYSDEQITAALNVVLADSNMYEFETVEYLDPYSGGDGMFAYPLGEQVTHFDHLSDVATLIRGAHPRGPTYLPPDSRPMFDDEIERAIAGVENDDWRDALATPQHRGQPFQDLRKGAESPYGGEIYFDFDWGVTVDLDVDEVRDELGEQLGELFGDGEEEEEDAVPPEERVLLRFDDGFYVQDLQSRELPEEGGKMGMCVGRPDMGYIAAVRRGEAKILSLRRPSGKPLLTFEVELADSGKPLRVIQVKGKANRLPGWNLGKVGMGPVKEDEVKKAAAVVRELGLAPLDVRDLVPGLQAVDGKPPRINPAADPDQHCGFCAPQGAGGGCVPRKGRRT